MHIHPHSPESPAITEGSLISWASRYDLTVNLMTLGLIRRLRSLTVGHALIKPGDRLLDVGCGTGGVTIPAGIRVGATGSAAGIDPSPEMIAIARRKANRAGAAIDFRVGVIESLPFPDETFDVVTSSLMMHHLPDHVREAGLAEVYRVLKPGGRLLIADMLRPGPSALSRVLLLLMHHGHAARFGLQDLPEFVRAAGFEPVELLDARFLVIGFVRARKPAVEPA